MSDTNNMTEVIYAKKCFKCGESKPASEYSKDKKLSDGLCSYCNPCKKAKSIAWKRTMVGLISSMYSGQKYTSKRRGCPAPDYSLEEFKCWCLSQPYFHTLWVNWMSMGYPTRLSPSADRTDDYKGYSLPRLKLMTWQENNNKGHSDAVNGINNKQSKAVAQLTKDGVFIKEFHSVSHASRETGFPQSYISQCCLGKGQTSGGFKWIYSQ